MKETKKTLYRVIALIWLLLAVVLIIGLLVRLFWPFLVLPWILGGIFGGSVSTVLMFHRFSTLNVEMDLERKKAVNHSRVMASMRSIMALAALFIGFRMPGVLSPVSIFAGLFATKIAALLYPAVYKDKRVSDS